MTAAPQGLRDQKKKRIITMILLAVLLMGVSMLLIPRDEAKTIIVTFPNGTEIEVEVADTPEKLLFGLAFQEALPSNGGMIYIFEATGPHRVTTKEYRFPVDMIWVDESRHIVSMAENIPPCRQDTCPWHGSLSEGVRYLIQTQAGFIQRQGLAVGGELKYTLRL
ncbi:MAG TPA: DUF192 domain-containing protein [Nitrospira sp.]|nr:DUF192 domain-containing protein [Nitrospira sp.]